jgi:hypothetical protein
VVKIARQTDTATSNAAMIAILATIEVTSHSIATERAKSNGARADVI